MTKQEQPTSVTIAQRDAIKAEYQHDPVTGRISQPGKFEGEPIFVPYYWDVALNGFADSDNGTTYGFRFRNCDSDFVLWPELREWLGRKRALRLAEDSQGFVRAF